MYQPETKPEFMGAPNQPSIYKNQTPEPEVKMGKNKSYLEDTMLRVMI